MASRMPLHSPNVSPERAHFALLLALDEWASIRVQRSLMSLKQTYWRSTAIVLPPKTLCRWESCAEKTAKRSSRCLPSLVPSNQVVSSLSNFQFFPHSNLLLVRSYFKPTSTLTREGGVLRSKGEEKNVEKCEKNWGWLW